MCCAEFLSGSRASPLALLAHGKVPGPDVSPDRRPAMRAFPHGGILSSRSGSFGASVVCSSILLQQPHNEFADELADLHVPERRLERELPDHVLSKRQF